MKGGVPRKVVNKQAAWIKVRVVIIAILLILLVLVFRETSLEDLGLTVFTRERIAHEEGLGEGATVKEDNAGSEDKSWWEDFSGTDGPSWNVGRNPKYCIRQDGKVQCRRVGAMLLVEGPLRHRIQSMCAAAALSSLSNFSTLSLWLPSPQLHQLTYSDLFAPASLAFSTPSTSARATSGGDTSAGSTDAGGGVGWRAGVVGMDAHMAESQLELEPVGAPWVEDVTGWNAEWEEKAQLFKREVSVSACKRGADNSDGLTTSSSPAPFTFHLYLSPNNINFMGVDDNHVCAFERHMRSCMGSLQPSKAVQRLVDAEDLPRIRKAYTTFVNTLPDSGCTGCSNQPKHTPALCAMRRLTMSYLKEQALDFVVAAHNPLDNVMVTRYFHDSRKPLVLQATMQRAGQCPLGLSSEAKQGGMFRVKRRLLVEGQGEEGAVVVGEGKIESTAITCAHIELSELFTLSHSKGMIAVHMADFDSQFIAAQGAARSDDMFRVQRPICSGQELRPITRQKFAMFTIIEPKLKMVYCAVPKVACNSWLMWLRARLGLPHPEDPLLALDEEKSGLKELAIHFTEEEAVNFITRPDFFKFTFVRNPFSRLASAYSNKIVTSDTPGKATGPGSRQYWNHAFFRFIKPLHDAVKDSNGLVTFPEFVRLVAAVMENYRWRMDRHIAPQVDICSLASIKYDYVGYFERMAEDVKTVVDKFGGEHIDIFNFGINAHFTNTDKKLARLYDKETYESVKKLYGMDFYIALNNITHKVPSALEERFESEL